MPEGGFNTKLDKPNCPSVNLTGVLRSEVVLEVVLEAARPRGCEAVRLFVKTTVRKW